MEKKKINFKILLPIVALSIIAIVVIVVIMPSLNAKNVVNNFSKAMEDKDIDKILSLVDFKGIVAWNSGFNEQNFSSNDYEDFIKEYNNVEVSKSNELKEKLKEYYNDFFNKDNYENIYIEETQKLCKDLYSIKVEYSFGGDSWGGQGKKTYIVYKGKIIAPFNIDFDNTTNNNQTNNESNNQSSNVSGTLVHANSTSLSKYDPTEVVEKYEKAVSNYTNTLEILENIDFKGTIAWIEAKGKYEKFIEIYDTISDDRIKEAEIEESQSWSYGSVPRKIINFETIKELGEDLFVIKAELKREGTPSYTSYYVVYKDKIIVPTVYTITDDYLSQYF